MKTRRPQIFRLLLLPPLVFLLVFYFYPLLRIVLLSFFPVGDWPSAGIDKLLTTPTYLKIFWFTCWQAGLSTLLTLLLALPCACVFARYDFPGKRLAGALLGLPFVLPTVVTAVAFQALLGRNGLINSLYTTVIGAAGPLVEINHSILYFLLAHVFYNYGLVVRIVGGYWAGLDPNVSEAAQLLGCSPRQAFFKVTLPQLLPSIGACSLLIFVFCFTSFGIILILGGPGYATVEVEIYRQSVQLFNLPMAACLSLLQIVVNFLLMWLHGLLTSRTIMPFYSSSQTLQVRQPRTFGEKAFLRSNLLLISLLLLLPLFALLWRSLATANGIDFTYYTALFTGSNQSLFFVEPIQAVRNSLLFALMTMAAALLLGSFAALFLAATHGKSSSFWDALVMLPLATSAVTLGFGYIVSMNRPPLDLRDSVVLVVIAHTLVAFPFVIRCLLPSLRKIPQTLREAATMLGCSPLQVKRRIDLMLLRGPLLVAAIFSFAISMGEFGATTFIARPHTPTMPIAIYRFLSQPGTMNSGQAMAMSCLLMLVTCSAFLLLDRFARM